MIITRLIEFLENRASPKIAILLVMLIIPFNALFFPLIGDQLESISGYRLLDSQFSYKPEEVFSRMQAYGEMGRKLYLFTDFTVDLIYPILYTLLFSILLTLLLRRGFSPESPLRRLQLLPFGMIVFDYLENIAICTLLITFPARPVALAWLASMFTTLKWCFGGMTGLALGVALVAVLISFRKTNSFQGD